MDAVPRSLLERHLRAGLEMAVLEDLEWLPGSADQPSPSFLTALRDLLPKDTSWGPVEEFESDKDWGSDLRIWHSAEPCAETPVESITLRYSPLADPVDLMKQYLELLASENCVVFNKQLETWFEPGFDEAISMLQRSRAYRFVNDPHGALEELAENPIKLPKVL